MSGSRWAAWKWVRSGATEATWRRIGRLTGCTAKPSSCSSDGLERKVVGVNKELQLQALAWDGKTSAWKPKGKLFDDAIKHYYAAVEADPSLAKSRVNLAALLAAKGDIEEATRQFNQAVQVDPSLEMYRAAVLTPRLAR